MFDLVQDTPALREKYRMDIIGFSTEGTPLKTADESPETAEKLWLSRVKYLELGEFEKADFQTQSLVNWRMDRDRKNLVPYAILLMREAFREADTDNIDRAVILLDHSILLAPDYPPAYIAKSYLSLRKSWLRFPSFLSGIFKGAHASFREAQHLTVLLGRVSLAAAFILVMTSAFLGIGLVACKWTYMRHDLEEYMSGIRRHGLKWKKIAILLAFLILFVFFSSPIWIIVLAIFITWAYQNWKERALSLSAVVLLASLPFLMWLASSSLLFLENDLNQTLIAVRNGSETASQAKLLEGKYKVYPDDVTIPFSLAQHYWRAGEYDRAGELFMKVREAGNLLKLESTINFGNILVAKGDLKGAAKVYREATLMKPDSAIAHYNLGQVLNLQFAFKEGQEELKKAMSLDKVLISDQSSDFSGNVYRTVLSKNLPFSFFIKKMLPETDLESLRASDLALWKLSLTGVPSIYYPLFIVLLAVPCLGYAYFISKRGKSNRCSKCGRPFCPLCLRGGAKSNICPQCQHIFVVREGIESAMRVEKMMEISSYQQNRRRTGFFLSALFPGSGHIYYGRIFPGALMALVISILFVLIIDWQGPIIDRYWLIFPWKNFFRQAALFFFLIAYIVNLLTTYRIGRKVT